jgi:predicted MFS family arabinose efflux permease
LKNSNRFQAVAFAIIRMVINTMHRMVYPFLAVFSRGLGVDLTTLSRLLATRSLIGMVGPLFATIGDSRGRKSGMLLGIGLFTVGTSIVVFWPTLPAFTAALLLTMLGKIIFDPPMQAHMGDRVPYARRGRVLAVTELGWSLAFIIGVPLTGFLISRWGWMSPFWTLTILGSLSLILLNWMIPQDTISRDAAPSVFANIQKVLHFLPALAGLAVGMFISAANEVINLIFGIWMEDAFGLQIAALGAAAAVIGFAELGGESMVGVFVDRLGKPRAISFGILGNCLAAIAFPFLGQTLIGAIVVLFLFYLTFEFTLVSTIPLMTEIIPSARATMMAINISALSLGRAIGAFVAPTLFDWGMGTSAGAAVVFNLLALSALRWVRHQDT